MSPYQGSKLDPEFTSIRLEFLQAEEAGNPGNSAQALSALRELAPGLQFSTEPGADYLLTMKPGTRPATADDLLHLIAVARLSGAAMVAPSRRTRLGEVLPPLMHFDGRALLPAPNPLATDPDPATGPIQAEGLAADVLLVRADCLDAGRRDLLRRGAAFEIHEWQQQLRVAGEALLWDPGAEFRQDRPELPQPLKPESRLALLDLQIATPLPRLTARIRAPRGAIGLPRRWRVAALTRDRWASSHYRVIEPLRWLTESGDIDPAALWCAETESSPGLPEFVEAGVDCVVFHHPFDDAALQLMADCERHLSCPRVLVIDDLMTDLPDYSPLRQRLPNNVGERVAEALARATTLVVTSPGLQQAFGTSLPTHVIENALAEQAWLNLPRPQPKSAGAPLRVGWAGAMQHAGDLALIEDLLAQADPRLQWVFLGMAPRGAEARGAEVHPMVPFDRYPRRLAELNLDLALVPLADNAFNRCKSVLKLIELGALGIPVIASDLDPYHDAPVPRVDADPRAWRAALEQLIGDAGARVELGRRLQDWVRSRHLLSHRRPAWLRALGVPA